MELDSLWFDVCQVSLVTYGAGRWLMFLKMCRGIQLN